MSVFDIIVTYHTGFLDGLLVTIKLCLIVWLSGLFLGTALGATASHDPIWGKVVHGGAFFLAAVPTLVVLFWLHYPAQSLLGDLTGTQVVIDPFYTSAFTFALVNVFAMAEMTRVAIRDFPQQYITAGRVCGLSTRDILLNIQLPLLFRQLLPGILTQQVVMLHMTLFASLISVEEIFRVAQRINATIYKPVEIYTALGIFFIGVCLPINLLAAYLQRRFTRNLSER
ncbi:MAG: ABC transporter permease subunit [Alphaproteobacteria bacterium]